MEHNIEILPNAKPHAEPLRRRPLAHKEETARQIKEMLKLDIIEPCESPSAAAYVIVKKTGDLRFCIDFRKLNEVTVKSSYPLPNIEECLEPFSQLDLASGFWQLPISEQARDLTSFRVEDGQYRSKRMPFGLCNAPASFQRLMNALFAALKGIHLQVFIDDLCLATTSWGDHLILLEKVFEILINAKLKLKANKCMFGCEEVKFLGHVLEKNGIRADPDKVRAITKLPTPKDTDEVRRVHGLLNYYRKLIPNFAMFTEPLTRLFKKGKAFEWGPEQANAFANIKKALTSDPVLAPFNQKDPLCLKTDASLVGVAGILLQRQGDDWRIITCCSRSTSAAERNYSITDLEGLAIVYCIQKLRNYLLGRHFTILTDHCALCSLKTRMSKNPRLRRWAILLSEFDFSIRYVKGQLHNDVDCLSRAPVDTAEDEYLEGKVLVSIKSSATSNLPGGPFGNDTDFFASNFCFLYSFSTKVSKNNLETMQGRTSEFSGRGNGNKLTRRVYHNVKVISRRTGKMSASLMNKWFDSSLLPAVSNNQFFSLHDPNETQVLLLADSWAGHSSIRQEENVRNLGSNYCASRG